MASCLFYYKAQLLWLFVHRACFRTVNAQSVWAQCGVKMTWTCWNKAITNTIESFFFIRRKANQCENCFGLNIRIPVQIESFDAFCVVFCFSNNRLFIAVRPFSCACSFGADNHVLGPNLCFTFFRIHNHVCPQNLFRSRLPAKPVSLPFARKTCFAPVCPQNRFRSRLPAKPVSLPFARKTGFAPVCSQNWVFSLCEQKTGLLKHRLHNQHTTTTTTSL